MVWHLVGPELELENERGQLYAATFTWQPLLALHLAAGVRLPTQVVNPRRGQLDPAGQPQGLTALWGRDLGDVYVSGGTFTARVIPDPPWWSKTEAQARADIGLP